MSEYRCRPWRVIMHTSLCRIWAEAHRLWMREQDLFLQTHHLNGLLVLRRPYKRERVRKIALWTLRFFLIMFISHHGFFSSSFSRFSCSCLCIQLLSPFKEVRTFTVRKTDCLSTSEIIHKHIKIYFNIATLSQKMIRWLYQW